MTNHDHILEEISRVGIQLLLREPFYAHILARLNKRVVDLHSEVKTLALGIQHNSYTLFVNSFFWEKWQTEPALRYGLLKHELLHLIFKHPLAREPGKDPLLFHVALDLVVNQYLDPEHLPPDAILPGHFPELQLLSDQSRHYYYQRLEELQAGRLGRYRSSRSAARLESLRSGSEALDRHQCWEEIAALSSPEKNILEGVIDDLVERAYRKTPEKDARQLPACLQIYLEKLFSRSPMPIDWRRAIRLFAASGAKTRIKNTIQRPSKRYGTVPGVKVKRLRKLLVVVDTSGSIHKEDIRRFFHEIQLLWRRGAEIRIVECDADIQQIYEYRGRVPSFVSGGGGTHFDPPIHYGNSQFLPDGLVYFTDGFAPRPEVKARFPILWVISPEGLPPQSEAFRELPGRKAKLPAIKP